MKRFKLLFISILICFSLCACSKSEQVIAAEEAISQIGVVDLDSRETIEQAEVLYYNLSEKDQKKVDNADLLLEARTALDNLISELCIPNTYIMLPDHTYYIVDNNSNIPNHNAYNFVPPHHTREVFDEYKDYVSSQIEITNFDSDSFSFLDDNGNTVKVRFLPGKVEMLQILVPK